MGTIGFSPGLVDSGGMPVVWDDQLRTPVQDPAAGGVNTYGSTDVFYDSSGNTYQVSVPDGTVYVVGSPSASPPAASGPPAAIVQSSADYAAGTPSPSHDESGQLVNPSDPANPARPTWRDTLYYVQDGSIIQKDSYSDGSAIYTNINMAAAPNLPNGTATRTAWDLAASNPSNQRSGTASTPASTPQNPASVQQQPTEPTAADGQTLSQQSVWTRATFSGLYGNGAAAAWVQQHNAALSQGAQQTRPAAQAATVTTQAGAATQAATVAAGSRLPAGAQTGTAVAGGLGGFGQTLGRPMRIGGMVLPTWAILGSLGAAYYVASGGRRRRR